MAARIHGGDWIRGEMALDEARDARIPGGIAAGSIGGASWRNGQDSRRDECSEE